MASTYKVEFILEDWMLSGLESGHFMIKSGSLLEAQSHQVVKWLHIANITPPKETRSILKKATRLANSAASVSSIESIANLALSVAIYYRLGTLEDKIDQSISQLRLILGHIYDTHDELLRGNNLYPIMTGFDLFQRARVSSNPEHLLKAGQVELVKGITASARWLKTRSCDQLLEHFRLMANISAALTSAAIIEAEVIRMLNKCPTDAELMYPFEEMKEVITHIEQELKKAEEHLPTSSTLERYKNLHRLRICNSGLIFSANEAMKLQIAINSGKTNIMKIDPSDNKVICVIHAPRKG